MIALYILAGIVALITFVLLMPIKLTIQSDESGSLYTSWRFLGYILDESSEGAPPPFKRSRYTKRAIRRRQKAAHRRKERTKKRALLKASGKRVTIEQPLLSNADIPLLDQLYHLKDLIEILFRHTLRYARVDIHRLAITVASDDAAQTAMLYGAFCAALSGVTEALHTLTNLHIRHPEKYGIAADFLGTEIKADVELYFRLPLIRALSLEARLLSRIFTREMEKMERTKK